MQRLARSFQPGLALALALAGSLAVHAATPPAGTVIGNRAAATYVNASGDTISVTSNEVETVVQQVGGVTLVANASETSAPGGKVFVPHTVTNTGNGTDTFSLAAIETVAGGAFDFDSILVYPDANGDGIADGTTTISATPALAAGDAYGIVIEARVPPSASVSASQDITVTATSQFDGGVAASVTDTVTVSSGAVTEIVKSMSVPGGEASPGDTVTVTLTYSSTGLADASTLIITDVLDSALTYDSGSARWSDSATALTEADDAFELTNGGGQQIDFQYDGSDTVTIEIDSVPSGRTGRVTFTATVAAGTQAGTIANTATQTVGGAAYPPSNTATVTVAETHAVTAADAKSATHQADPDSAVNLVASPGSSTDDDATLNDVVTESADVHQGGSIRFEFVVTNQSNVTDTISVSVANTSFPAGTTLQILGSDAATPVVGPLGPLASGATATVNVVATLPPNATATASGSTNYAAVLSAQASKGGSANTATARFTGAVLAAAVDLQNKDATGAGNAPNNGGDPWKDFNVAPGEPATYVVTVQNEGPTADTYALTLDTALPSGWTAQFFLPDGTPVTNTGAIAGGAEVDITVVVTPSATATPVDQPVTLRVTSPATGQSDTLTNAVVVGQVVDLALAPSQTVQVAPGGVADILHTLKNEGNITITEGAISLDGSFSTFSGTIFHDTNANGRIDAADGVVDNIDDIAGGIAPGATVPLILRVSAPSTGAVGVAESETLRVATSLNGGAASEAAADQADNAVTDTVVIVSNDLTLTKEQALDAACNGTLGAFTAARIQASPGQCIRYRIVADNTGTADAGSVVIRDTTPGYTTLTECAGSCSIALVPGTATVSSKPAEGAAGALETSHGTIAPGASASLSFTVRIDP